LLQQLPERAKLKGLKAAAFDVEHVFAKPAKLQYEAIMAAHTARPADVVLAEQNFAGGAFLLAHQRPMRPAVVVSNVIL